MYISQKPPVGKPLKTQMIKIENGEVFIKTNGAGITIDGQNAYSEAVKISSLYEQINLISDGSNWFIY